MQTGVACCQLFQTFVAQNSNILFMLWVLGEAWFHLSGYIISCVFVAADPHGIHGEPFCVQKVEVPYAVLRTCIIGPIFSDTSFSSDCFLDVFQEFVCQFR
jgi:hypothetical protein